MWTEGATSLAYLLQSLSQPQQLAYLIIVLKQYSQYYMQMCPEEEYSTVVKTLIIDAKIRVGVEEAKNHKSA